MFILHFDFFPLTNGKMLPYLAQTISSGSSTRNVLILKVYQCIHWGRLGHTRHQRRLGPTCRQFRHDIHLADLARGRECWFLVTGLRILLLLHLFPVFLVCPFSPNFSLVTYFQYSLCNSPESYSNYVETISPSSLRQPSRTYFLALIGTIWSLICISHPWRCCFLQ